MSPICPDGAGEVSQAQSHAVLGDGGAQNGDLVGGRLKKPVFAGEEGICAGCGVATLSISYYDLGYTTGEMAVKILKGESNVSDMPIEYTDVTKKYNKTICDDLGLTAPEGYEAIEG